MARGDKFNIYLLNAAGDFYTATKNVDNTWTIATASSADPLTDELYVKHLPSDWDKTQISYERNTTYYGVFRSMSTNYKFAEDARAILLHLYSLNNTQAYCRMRIDILLETAATPADVWSYETFYASDIDFSEVHDNKVSQLLTATTLDSKLYALLKANASKSFNIPFYTRSGGSWLTDAKFIYHDGIKLLWRGNWTSGATPTHFLDFTGTNSINGFNHGNHGTGINFGVHCIPPMSIYNIVQNNGATTYIGNTILQPFLLTGSQQNGTDYPNEQAFDGLSQSQPYTKDSFSIKDLFPDTVGDVELLMSVKGKFEGNINMSGGTANRFIGFVLFEVDSENNKSVGIFTYQPLMLYPLPFTGSFTPANSGYFSNYIEDAAQPYYIGTPMPVTLKTDKVYVFGIIYDNDSTGIGGTVGVECAFSNLEFTVYSAYNSGSSTAPAAPRFPPSTTIAYRAWQVWDKLVHVIDSLSTDAYGFPTGGGAYSGTSTYLTDTGASRADDYDLKAYDMMYTSENAIKLVNGQPYLNTSIQEFFGTWFKIAGCGLGLEGNNLVIEKLSYFFDAATMIYDLGTNVANFEIEPLTNIKGDYIRAGYAALNTNNNFGVDAFNIEQHYSTQLINTPKDIDLTASSIIAEQTTIELARSQQTSKDQSSPSSSNGTILLDTNGSIVATPTVLDPSLTPVVVSAYGLQKYPTAQNSDPTASSFPYVRGLYYPDTAINLSLTPASCIRRLGGYLTALTYGTSGITFRKQYQMLYNDKSTSPTSLALPGISKNLESILIDEVADIPFASLDSKLFRPDMFKIETKTPVNFYAIINANPRGYIQFSWTNREGINTVYKGFIWNVTQNVGNNASTTLTLLAHPDTTDADITAA